MGNPKGVAATPAAAPFTKPDCTKARVECGAVVAELPWQGDTGYEVNAPGLRGRLRREYAPRVRPASRMTEGR